jgi:hypothetical protein
MDSELFFAPRNEFRGELTDVAPARFRRTWTRYDGLIPVPPHLWHLTILSPFLSVPLPSQFLHGFFLSVLLGMVFSRSIAAPMRLHCEGDKTKSQRG